MKPGDYRSVHFEWKGYALHLFGKGKPIVTIVPDVEARLRKSLSCMSVVAAPMHTDFITWPKASPRKS
jgi:hypothetical protein